MRVPTTTKSTTVTEDAAEYGGTEIFRAGESVSVEKHTTSSDAYSYKSITWYKTPPDGITLNRTRISGGFLYYSFKRTQNIDVAKTYSLDYTIKYTKRSTKTERIFKVKRNGTVYEKIKLNGSIVTPKA